MHSLKLTRHDRPTLGTAPSLFHFDCRCQPAFQYTRIHEEPTRHTDKYWISRKCTFLTVKFSSDSAVDKAWKVSRNSSKSKSPFLPGHRVIRELKTDAAAIRSVSTCSGLIFSNSNFIRFKVNSGEQSQNDLQKIVIADA